MMTARQFSRMRGLRFSTSTPKRSKFNTPAVTRDDRRYMRRQDTLTRLGELLTGNPWDK